MGTTKYVTLLLWLLSTIVQCQNTPDQNCKVYAIYNDVTLYGGMKAGLYLPFEGPNAPAHMTVTKCTEHCCKTVAADLVFLLNKYCYCVMCINVHLCRPVPITPPRGFKPIAVILRKGMLRAFFGLATWT